MSITSPTAGIDSSLVTEQGRFAKLAGVCGFAATVAYLVTILAASLLGRPEVYDGPDDVVRYFSDVSDQSTGPIVYGVAGIAMCLLFLPLGAAVFEAMQRTALAALGSLAMVVGLLALMPAYAISIIEATVLSAAADDVGADSAGALYTVAETTGGVSTISFTVGSILTLGISPLLWGLTGLRSGALTPWLARTAVVVGVTGAIWFVWLFETPVVLTVLLVNVAASLVLFAGLSRKLIAGDRAHDAALADT